MSKCHIVRNLMSRLKCCYFISTLTLSFAGHRCKHMPGAMYLTAISLSDTLVLGFSAMPFAFGFLFKINLYDVNLWVCKMVMMTEHMFKFTSIWFIVTLTVIRTVMVCRPLKSIGLMSKQMTVLIFVFIILLSVVINIPFGMGANLILHLNNSTTPVKIDMATSNDTSHGKNEGAAEISRYDGQATCKLDPASFLFKHEKVYHNWSLDFGFLFSLPLLVITVSNVTVLIVIKRQKRKLTTKDSCRSSQSDGSLNRSMTTWVITISTFHVISEGFWAISSQVEGFLENIYKDEIITWWYITTCCIWYLNHAINFIFYSVFGSAFRDDFIRIFCSNRWHKENDRHISVFVTQDTLM